MRNKIKAIGVKKIVFGVLVLLIMVIMLLAVSLDCFSHGFYCDPLDVSNIEEQDFLGTIDLGVDRYEMVFLPTKPHLSGVEIIFTNIIDDSGYITVSTYELNGKKIESVEIELNKIRNNEWYIVNFRKKYKAEEKYKLLFESVGCESSPSLQLVDRGYLPKESIDSELLISYGYSEPTFDISEKAIIDILICIVVIFLFGELYLVKKDITRKASLFLAMVVLLSWNYIFNSFCGESICRGKSLFSSVSMESEYLVRGVIEAEQNGVALNKYGLGALETPFYDKTDEDDFHGLSRTWGMTVMLNNQASERIANAGNIIRFRNGEEIEILDVEKLSYNYKVALDYYGPLNYYKFGSIDEATFISSNGCEIPNGFLTEYKSQYGLQGKVLRHLARMFSNENAEKGLMLICAIASAIVFTLITVLVGYKYDKLMAFCFGMTFFLSPWVTSFARSLYWAVYLWFIPMLIGLIVSIKHNNKCIRYSGYMAAFISIFIKSLCGYEFITSIMLGLIAFPLADLLLAIVHRERTKVNQLFKMIFVLGVVALLGFFAAICVHANLRGEGNLINGIRLIFEEDVLRRVGGGSMNDFDAGYWASLNASIWDVIKLYFHFSTDIITGINGKLFPAICMIPFIIFTRDYLRKQIEWNMVILYVVFFIAGISWIVLCKSHSYVHTHVNFLIWYFGFIQICFYIIIKKAHEIVKKATQE